MMRDAVSATQLTFVGKNISIVEEYLKEVFLLLRAEITRALCYHSAQCLSFFHSHIILLHRCNHGIGFRLNLLHLVPL